MAFAWIMKPSDPFVHIHTRIILDFGLSDTALAFLVRAYAAQNRRELWELPPENILEELTRSREELIGEPIIGLDIDESYVTLPSHVEVPQ